jgi:hypothetical protein
VRDAVLGDRGRKGILIRHVTADERDAAELVRRHDLPQALRVVAQVVGDDAGFVFDEQSACPRAQAAERARDEERVRQSASSPRQMSS